MSIIQQSGTPVNLTSSGTVSIVSGSLIGFYVNSTTAGTVVIEVGSDGDGNGTAVSGTITPAIGWHSFPAYCVGGCYAVLANTIDVTFFFAAG